MNFDEQKKVFIKYGGDECEFFYMENNMVSLTKGTKYFGPFQVILENINT